jgi:dihydrofolate reductase
MPATVYIATSLDGFIARPDGAIDWLPHGGGDGGDGEDYGYKRFMATVDALVMGRNTYEKVLTFGGWPYGSKPVVVLSSKPVRIAPDIAGTVESMSGTPAEVVERLAARGYRHLYVDGGQTIQRFLNAGFIDRLIVTRVPVLIGEGIPLFGRVPRDIPLRHVATRSYPSGLVQSEYEIRRAP